jgi:hypothetical protein
VLASDPLPPPVGRQLHLIAYAETAASFAEAEDLAKHAALRPVLKHLAVRAVQFDTRDQKVVGWAPLSKADLEQYEHDRALAN